LFSQWIAAFYHDAASWPAAKGPYRRLLTADSLTRQSKRVSSVWEAP